MMPSLIKSYLLEATSGILKRSSQFQAIAWIKTNVTVTADDTTSPNGDSTADKLEHSSSNSLIHQVLTQLTANADYRFSVYLKSATGGNVAISIRLWNVSFGLIKSEAITVTTSWQKFEVESDIGAITKIVVSIGGSSTFITGEDVYAWKAQLEPVALDDRMVMSDAMAFAFGSKLNLTPADSMTMTDALAKTLSQRGTLGLKGNFDNYIRKYLNDPS